MSKVIVRNFAQQILEGGGITPLEFMLNVMNDLDRPFELRYDAAKNAAPYVHPRYTAIKAQVSSPRETKIRLITEAMTTEEASEVWVETLHATEQDILEDLREEEDEDEAA